MLKIIGGDSETCHGRPISFQFYSEDEKYMAFIPVKKGRSFLDFIAYCGALPSDDTQYYIFLHNLKFDLISFFNDRLPILAHGKISYTWKRWEISGIYSNTTFLNLYNKNSHKSVHLIDTSAFFLGSLKNLADLFCPGIKKLDQPKKLGEYYYTEKNKSFVAYAMRDAEIAYHIGKYIIDLHTEYDIPVSVSAPQMASKIFRRVYLQKTIPLPADSINYSALHSYHGGKNDWLGKPGLYTNVYGLDIISAYSHAMTNLPSFYHAELYKNFYGLDYFSKKQCIPDCGVYKISGFLKICDHPIICNAEFEYLHGEIQDVWSTGYEINEALDSGELKITNIFGYYYEAKKDHDISPIAEYAKDFFKLKNAEKEPIKKYFYKIMLNSLYGKFIQAINRTENIEKLVELNKHGDVKGKITKNIREAGGLFHPFIASLITGYTRAKIHQLEHKYDAIHTATDGIICRKKPKKFGKKLGDIKLEFEGKALILRNKLYIIYNNNKNEKIKSALHGFHGTIEALEKCWREKNWEYKYIKVNKLKESLNRGLVANDFHEVIAKINIKGENDAKNN